MAHVEGIIHPAIAIPNEAVRQGRQVRVTSFRSERSASSGRSSFSSSDDEDHKMEDCDNVDDFFRVAARADRRVGHARASAVSMARSSFSSIGFSPQANGSMTPSSRGVFPKMRRLADLMRHGSTLRPTVLATFASVTGEKLELDIEGLTSFIEELSIAIDVPDTIFGVLEDELTRFDFNGQGTVNSNETFKLVKYHLREYARTLGPSYFETSMETKTLEEEGFHIVRTMGQGSFGLMQLALDKSGTARAIKCCEKASMDEKMLQELREEFTVMQHHSNEHMAKTFDIFQDTSYYYLINEPYFGGDFTKLTEKAKATGVTLSENWWRNLFKQCFDGLSYCHRHAMMHCDVKEPNMMLKTAEYDNPEVVLIDYGLVQAMARNRVQLCGTPGYIPPETWRNRKWFPKGDCFSMGVTMLQMLVDKVPLVRPAPHGQPPTAAKTLKAGLFTENARSLEEVRSATLKRPLPLHLLPPEATQLSLFIQKLLARDPKSRVTSIVALEDDWFTDPYQCEPEMGPGLNILAPARPRASSSPSNPSNGDMNDTRIRSMTDEPQCSSNPVQDPGAAGTQCEETAPKAAQPAQEPQARRSIGQIEDPKPNLFRNGIRRPAPTSQTPPEQSESKLTKAVTVPAKQVLARDSMRIRTAGADPKTSQANLLAAACLATKAKEACLKVHDICAAMERHGNQIRDQTSLSNKVGGTQTATVDERPRRVESLRGRGTPETVLVTSFREGRTMRRSPPPPHLVGVGGMGGAETRESTPNNSVRSSPSSGLRMAQMIVRDPIRRNRTNPEIGSNVNDDQRLMIKRMTPRADGTFIQMSPSARTLMPSTTRASSWVPDSSLTARHGYQLPTSSGIAQAKSFTSVTSLTKGQLPSQQRHQSTNLLEARFPPESCPRYRCLK
uniref:Protein kinase domain-containing protein n=1 Tax=Noctiluca scintillans TaxID=2966 RepID=A0A6T8ZWM8_NOCSC